MRICYAVTNWLLATVKYWSDKGYGFAETEDGETVYLHASSFRTLYLESLDTGFITWWPGKHNVPTPKLDETIRVTITKEKPDYGETRRAVAEWTTAVHYGEAEQYIAKAEEDELERLYREEEERLDADRLAEERRLVAEQAEAERVQKIKCAAANLGSFVQEHSKKIVSDCLAPVEERHEPRQIHVQSRPEKQRRNVDPISTEIWDQIKSEEKKAPAKLTRKQKKRLQFAGQAA